MKRNQLYLSIGALTIMLALTGCGHKTDNNQPVNTEKPVGAQENLADNQEESYFSEKIVDMFKKGKPLVCTTEMESEEGLMTAVYYFDNANERLRVDMKMVGKGDGVNVNTTSISKDGWDYFWDDLMNKDGLKVKIEEDNDTAETGSPVDNEEKFEFRCRSWQVEADKFELPADKSFKDISDLGQIGGTMPVTTETTVTTGATGSAPDVCSFCNMIPAGPERDECLSSC